MGADEVKWSGTPEEREAKAKAYAKNSLATRVKRDGDCLRWVGSHDKNGYGRISYLGVNRLAHVLVWEFEHGPILDGLDVDHVYRAGCRFRDCIRIEHLEAVTTAVNCQRGRPYHKVGLCAKGIHPQTEPGKCLECNRDWWARNKHRRRTYNARYYAKRNQRDAV